MAPKMFVYCVEIEWLDNDSLFRDEFHGYAESATQAVGLMEKAIAARSVARPGNPRPTLGARVVGVRDLGEAVFRP